jgi:HK97 family phage portal protein
MKWMTRIFKSFGFYPASGGAELSGRFLGGASKIAYNSRDAEANTIVMAAVRWACTNIIEPPLLAAVSHKGEMVPAPDHPLTNLIRNPIQGLDVNFVTTGSSLRMGLVASLLLDGNAYLLKLRGANGDVIGLDWVSHTGVQVRATADGSAIEGYSITRFGRVAKYPPEDIIHFRWLPDFDNPFLGSSPLKNCMRQVLSDNQIAIYTHALLRSPWPSALLSPSGTDASWTRADMETVLADFKRQASGERAGHIMGLTAPAKIDRLSISPKDMDVQIMARLSEERLSANIGIPAVVIGLGAGLDRATFSNYAEARQAATEDFLVPMWRIIESTLNDQLLSEFKIKGVEYMHDLSDVRALQDDMNELATRVNDMFKTNIINRAEARLMLGLTPAKGDDQIYAWMLEPGGFAGPVVSKSLRESVERGLRDVS